MIDRHFVAQAEAVDAKVSVPELEDEEPEEEEPEEIDVNLTPIGRAAVEMAWLGSMAVTCFGPT